MFVGSVAISDQELESNLVVVFARTQATISNEGIPTNKKQLVNLWQLHKVHFAYGD